jgi:hypothetical protein
MFRFFGFFLSDWICEENVERLKSEKGNVSFHSGVEIC